MKKNRRIDRAKIKSQIKDFFTVIFIFQIFCRNTTQVHVSMLLYVLNLIDFFNDPRRNSVQNYHYLDMVSFDRVIVNDI